MTRKTILFVVGSLDIGGTEKHLVQVLPRLDRKSWNPVVYCLTGRGELADEINAAGVEVLVSAAGVPPGRNQPVQRFLWTASTVIRLAQAMRNLKPDIVHLFLPAAYILGAPAALLARAPVCLMSRRSLNDYQNNSRSAALIERVLHRRMSGILGNSMRVLEQLAAKEGVPRRHLGLIHNGIDARRYGERNGREAVRASLALPDDALVFLMVANLIPYKGHADLIKAFAIAAKRLPQWRLLLAGRDNGIGAQLRQQAEAAGLIDNIIFLGARADVPDLLACADVSMLTSHQEGFSNAVIEGMAARLPSIVTDVGGNAEAVIGGEHGLVVPPHDPNALADAIVALGNDTARRAEMGTHARQRVVDQFSLGACVTKYETLYSALLDGRDMSDVEAVRPTWNA